MWPFAQITSPLWVFISSSRRAVDLTRLSLKCFLTLRFFDAIKTIFPEKNDLSNYSSFRNPNGECLQYLFPKPFSEFKSICLYWRNFHVPIQIYFKEISWWEHNLCVILLSLKQKQKKVTTKNPLKNVSILQNVPNYFLSFVA